MAVLKCKMCGGQLNAELGQKTIQCRYCDSVQTIPNLDDEEKIKMFTKATELRLQCEFDQASSIFHNIIMQFPNEAEAYWGLCLCKYGIEYVNDPATFEKVPTCHRTYPTSILNDVNYLTACKYSDTASWKYEEEALKIDEIQKKILEISLDEKPYDIFICYKETDDNSGIRTDDSITAQDIYTEFVKNNYRVFYSRISLRGKAGTEYEPYIYSALSSAKVMIVLGSKKEYFEAVWLKNEWSRYLDMMNGSKKAIIPCYETIDVSDLPAQLRGFQALDMSNKIFFSDLLSSIERIIPANKSVVLNSTAQAEDLSAAPRKKELNFDDRVYIGEALGNRPHGYGTCFYTNGNKYEGHYAMGVINGEGTFTYKSGDVWHGEWKEGNAWNGSGTYKVIENKMSFCYEGTLKNGKLDGEGKKYTNDKLTREGFFVDGLLNGNGVAYNPDGTVCSGEFKNGYPYNAEGTYVLKSLTNVKYTGKWINGQPAGEGTAVHAEDTYTGIFSGELTGENITWLRENALIYQGNLVNGRAEGNGRQYNKDGSVLYEGSFKNSNHDGYGILYYSDDVRLRYEGEFKEGHAEGMGTLFYPEGTWSGEFKCDKSWNGNGIIVYRDENGKATGKFFNGIMTNGLANGNGMLRLPNGTHFNGEFKNGEYYNGTLYNSFNQFVDTYICGESQNEKKRRQRVNNLNTASRILNWFS